MISETDWTILENANRELASCFEKTKRHAPMVISAAYNKPIQRRAWNVLLANAYNELPDKDIHSVSMVELAAKLGFDSGNQEYPKEVLRSLRSCEVEWNLLNKANKQVWGVASLLASAEIKDGICTYGFAPHLRLKLHNPRIYAKLNLRLQNRFKSQYALVLWEVCFDYFDADRDQGERFLTSS